MSDVEIPFDDKAGDNATLLLAAAEELGVGFAAVRTVTGAFLVSEEVANKAGLGEKKPAKKTAEKTAKKTAKKTAEKTVAKKAPAKATTAPRK